MIENIAVDEVEAWLAERGMVAKPRIGTSVARPPGDTLIVYSLEIEERIRRAERGEDPLLIEMPDGDRTTMKWDRILHRDGRLVFMPVQRAGRHYHSPFGFFRGMEEAVKLWSEAETIIPPGIYGERDVKRPRRAMPLNLVFGLRLLGPRSLNPQHWPVTQQILRERETQSRARKRVRAAIRATETRLGVPVPPRYEAVFTPENASNPWVLAECPECGGHVADCLVCGGLGTNGEAERYFENDAPALPAKVGGDGWVRCPGCQKRFATYDTGRLAGNRHHTCGQKIILIYPEGGGSGR